jgi:hypothetical protein
MKPPERSPAPSSGPQWLAQTAPRPSAPRECRQGKCRHGGRRRGEPHTAAARSIEELAASTQTELGRRKGGKRGEAVLPRVLGRRPDVDLRFSGIPGREEG